MRGNARNFDDNGVCGPMKLVVVGDLDLWLSQHSLLFPGASLTVSEETKQASGVTTAQRIATYILDHPEGFTSKELIEATEIDPSHLAKWRRSPVVTSAMATAGLEIVRQAVEASLRNGCPRLPKPSPQSSHHRQGEGMT